MLRWSTLSIRSVYMTTFSLGYPQVESVLANLHHVSPEKRMALTGRVKNLQRKGWGIGSSRQRGKTAEYNVSSLIDLALAMELLALGISPEMAVELLRGAPNKAIRAGAQRVGKALAAGLEDGTKEMGRVLANAIVLVLDAPGFASLRDEGAGENMIYSVDASDGEMDDLLYGGRRMALVNLNRLFLALSYAVARHGVDATEFGSELQSYAETLE